VPELKGARARREMIAYRARRAELEALGNALVDIAAGPETPRRRERIEGLVEDVEGAERDLQRAWTRLHWRWTRQHRAARLAFTFLLAFLAATLARLLF
jgi:hypothetical protein